MGISMSDEDRAGSVRPKEDSGAERREHDRVDVAWTVDCVADDTFLFASIANISQMGIFVRTIEPLAIGTRMNLTMQTNGGGTAYKIQVADPTLPSTPIIYMTNQAGASLPTNTAFP